MRNKIVAFAFILVCALVLSSCMLLMSPQPAPEPRYEIVGNWRRTAGEFDSTITYYLKADGTYSYSNNQNGRLDSGEYTVDWANHIIQTNHKMNHSLDESLSFRFDGPNVLYIDDFAYKRL
ncbi:MAG: hypothetical protein II753_05830 [Spirochaetales bacterium]|nr:hypothetical protein [Spirochaetales bacterium]MBQ5391395.1 hypothetical protein [Spirochaetales bacterium]MBQ6125195.1 hypothetical protein [Spirochaetales bacterium]